MAAYNEQEFIEPALLALAAQQTNVQWELIVADNGSTDGTLEIAERLISHFGVPVRLLDASHRRSASAARNAAALAARGEFLLFTDADDVADAHWLQEMVDTLREHPYVGGEARDCRAEQ